jgi:hypothetical protein
MVVIDSGGVIFAGFTFWGFTMVFGVGIFVLVIAFGSMR